MDNDEQLVVVGLRAENVMRLEVVDLKIDAEEPLVEVEGRNAQGKTCVLNSIAMTLGGKRLCPPQPIKKGHQSAEARVSLGGTAENPKYIVTRRWRRSGSGINTGLTVEMAGQKIGRAQTVLNALLGDITFDPKTFSDSHPLEQVKMLLRAANAEDELAQIEIKRKEAYDSRREANAAAKQLEAAIELIPPAPPGLPKEKVITADLMEQLEEARAEHEAADDLNSDIKRRRKDSVDLRRQKDDLAEDRKRSFDRVKRLEDELAIAKAEVKDIGRKMNRLDDRIAAVVEEGQQLVEQYEEMVEKLPDLEAISANISNNDTINRHIDNQERRARLREEVAAKNDFAANLTTAINLCDAEKQQLLAGVVGSIGIPGLEIDLDQGALTLNGLPLSEASTSELWRTCILVGMALNPKIRVIHVNEWSLLDKDAREIIRDLAREKGYQVWAEIVTDGGNDNPAAIVIEDGMVKYAPAD